MATAGYQNESDDHTTYEEHDQEATYNSGYDAIFTPELEKKYECPICLRAMRDAMQTSCGHRFCESCIMTVVNQRLFAKCPVDNMWFRCHDELFPDNAVRREILSLTVQCKLDFCLWKGELRDVERHTNVCSYKWVTCKFGCKDKIRRHEMTRHLCRCELRPVSCDHCNMSVTYNYLMKHQVLECDKFPVQCTLCGESGIQREDIQHHTNRDAGNCPNVIIPCQFQKYGCIFEDKRNKMVSHLTETVSVHLDMAVKRVENLESHLDQVSQRITAYNSTSTSMYAECLTKLRDVTSEQMINFSGQLTWKIPFEEGQTKFCSKSFYTGIPGYKLHAVLELSASIDNFASLFVVFEKGKFDDDMFFPLNAKCKATVFGQKSPHENYSTTIHCTNVPRCRTEGELSNYQRGRLKFILCRQLLSPKHCGPDGIFMQIKIYQINECQVNEIE